MPKLRRSARLAMKRRGKPNTTFIKHRPTVLDILPMDVIKHQIFAYLDYESRINLNQCLPIWDRIPSKMPKQSILKHDIEFRIRILKRMLNSLNETTVNIYTGHTTNVLSGDARIMLSTKLFKAFQEPMCFSIIKLYTRFRDVVVRKINEFEESIAEDYSLYSNGLVDNFILEINNLKNKMENERGAFSSSSLSLASIKPLSHHFFPQSY